MVDMPKTKPNQTKPCGYQNNLPKYFLVNFAVELEMMGRCQKDQCIIIFGTMPVVSDASQI